MKAPTKRNMNDPKPIYADEIPTERRERLLNGAARGIVNRRLAGAALVVLETCKPLNFVGSQFMLALHPIVSIFFKYKADDYRNMALILESDAHFEELIDRIETLEQRRRNGKPQEKAQEKNGEDSHGG